MAEEPQDVESEHLARLRHVTFKELDEFYDEMGTEHACENCQSEGWTHLCDADGPVAVRIPAFNRESVFAVAFVIICSRCGNLRQTNGGTVLTWLRKKEEQ